ncbi:UDP-N-acetylmuramoyl-tripeptide--D-alanyl-D-alanine ligase [Patescibacteria group bacterium]|nr:UDP-N-acetylmuramoyl-tripeptide--D-alanyl-D-alanine ligase [Patescibacteria group bacterium]MBU4367932.1 UDP-N-acetylmuramoyl-tripeptide--D-alanyl-D-alanine ligase [Patescibacteria group bacterium]MBU4462270.1 UDP-N-acetylmuramoyl-tripeptide--D-alanyl-D-alanine ligase [Patescibacteria group bacterium]MCG2699542.1 UDP-N-acetylmuramoyl-tripeptide--D-alanyl-D-alanine ligase [Candidatus Parcubacteria bacterium]
MDTISPLIIFLLPFWFVRNTKHILFWIYLWQLKQYHRGRFFSHFKTEKGKKLLLHPLQIIKVILLIISFLWFLFLPKDYLLFLYAFLFLIYFLESLLYFKALFAKRAKNPAFTKKTIFLFVANFLIAMIFAALLLLFVKNIFWFAFLILIFEILLPLIVSLVVILIQPMADSYRLSLQKKAKEKIGSFKKDITIIAITGSYGKTSTKEYLTTILSQRFQVLATKEHQNTEVAIPQMILNELNEKYDIFIVEMGAYDKGTIKRICEFLKPKIGVVTGVNEQHLALFGLMENLLSAEGGKELLESLPKDGLLVINGENDYCLDLYRKADVQKISYSFDKLKNINIEKDSVSFSIEDVSFNVNIFGKHSLLNLLGAISIAKSLGMSFEEISKATKKISARQSSYKISESKEGFDIIDSTYSANPAGVIADLEYLKLFSGKKVIVMPCLIELGKAAKEVHQKIGKKIAEVCDLAIITTKECFDSIKDGALENGMKKENIELINDANLISGKIKSFCKSNDTILLEGRISENIISKIKIKC